MAQLNSSEPALVVAALRKLEELNEAGVVQWVPPEVIRMISPEAAVPDVRRHAVRLLGKLDYPGRLTLLEILLFHPEAYDTSGPLRLPVGRRQPAPTVAAELDAHIVQIQTVPELATARVSFTEGL